LDTKPVPRGNYLFEKPLPVMPVPVTSEAVPGFSLFGRSGFCAAAVKPRAEKVLFLKTCF
jgi:hypothetical protein